MKKLPKILEKCKRKKTQNEAESPHLATANGARTRDPYQSHEA